MGALAIAKHGFVNAGLVFFFVQGSECVADARASSCHNMDRSEPRPVQLGRADNSRIVGAAKPVRESVMEPRKSYVRTDEHGVMRVGQTRVMLDSVVAAFQQGHSPETIQQQYPALTLEQVYGAIAYYLANRVEVDQYLERQGEVWRQWREKAAERASPVVQRLRAQAAEAGTEAL